MANLFKKARAATSNYVGSVSGDANQIKDTVSKFGSVDSISNMFDQRIADGLTDLLSGATGIRTTNIPEISAQTLQTREANREARAQSLNANLNRGEDVPPEQLVLKFPQNFPTESDESGNMQNYIHFRSLQRRNTSTTNKEELYDIFLYVPNTMTDGTSIEYEAGEKGLIEGLLAKFMGRGGGGTDQGIFPQLGQMWKDAAGGSIGKHKSGTVINPMKFQVFKGVGPREFQYSFELYPENQTESLHIRSICYAFKKSSLPGIVPESGNKIYTFPNEWAIRYHGPMKKWIDYPMVSVLKTVGVDYNTGGNARFHDGAPVAVKLDLTFQEVFTLDRNKYDERVSAEINQGNNNREISQEHGSYPDVMNFDDTEAAMSQPPHAKPVKGSGE